MLRFSEFLSGRIPFFYGYVVMIVAMFAQICSSPGQTFAISPFTPFLQDSLGLSSSKLSAAYMIGTLLAAFPLFAIGPLSDRFGLRVTTFCVALGLAMACFVTSRVNSFVGLVGAFLMLRFLGQGAMTLLAGNIVSMWFRRRLGTVNSIMSAGGAAAFAIVPVVLLTLIESWGWRMTYVAMGVCVLVIQLPLLLLVMRNRPEDLGLETDGVSLEEVERQLEMAAKSGQAAEPELTLREAMGHRTFWILMAGMGLWAMIGTGVVFHALPIFEQFKIPPTQTKLLFTTFSASMLVAQIVGGVLADRLPMNRLMACGFAGLLAGIVIIPFTSQWYHVHWFAFFFGAGQGVAISVNSTMWVRYYGRKHLGKIRGTVWCTTVAGSGCGPLILGLFFDNWGSFTPGVWLFAGLLVPLVVLSLFATAPAIDPVSRASAEVQAV